jgi:hypothetical protein
MAPSRGSVVPPSFGEVAPSEAAIFRVDEVAPSEAAIFRVLDSAAGYAARVAFLLPHNQRGVCNTHVRKGRWWRGPSRLRVCFRGMLTEPGWAGVLHSRGAPNTVHGQQPVHFSYSDVSNGDSSDAVTDV